MYGTLMRGEPAHQVCAPFATFVGEARVTGTLVHLGQYPGMIAGRGMVRGEVWRLHAPNAAEVLRTLDQYEGYNFQRCTVTATLTDGRRVRVLVYRYRERRTGAPPAEIPDGDWRRHRWRSRPPSSSKPITNT